MSFMSFWATKNFWAHGAFSSRTRGLCVSGVSARLLAFFFVHRVPNAADCSRLYCVVYFVASVFRVPAVAGCRMNAPSPTPPSLLSPLRRPVLSIATFIDERPHHPLLDASATGIKRRWRWRWRCSPQLPRRDNGGRHERRLRGRRRRRRC